jgi:hypothetical protein
MTAAERGRTLLELVPGLEGGDHHVFLRVEARPALEVRKMMRRRCAPVTCDN